MDDEKKLVEWNDSLNPEPPKFGMPWYVIMGILIFSLILFFVPYCRIPAVLFAPCTLGIGWWLCKDDPKEPLHVVNDLFLPSEFDPGKD
jgi:hypothetical protein